MTYKVIECVSGQVMKENLSIKAVYQWRDFFQKASLEAGKDLNIMRYGIRVEG